MTTVRVAAFSLSIDGFGAGPHQALEHPLGLRGLELHDWFFRTAVFKKTQGETGGAEGVDNDFAGRSFENVGAWVIGRNMFSPLRGAWEGDTWRGWWGENPPFHAPVFVLTHHARPPLVMEGGTNFQFVTGGPSVALARAKDAASGKDVRIGGGVATVRHFLEAQAIDSMHLALSPVLLGGGEHLFSGLNLSRLGFSPPKIVPGEIATHILLNRQVSDGA